MAKEEIKRAWPEGGLVCWPKEYAGRDLPSDDETKSVVIGLWRCEVEDARPEYGADLPNMTGRYEGEASVCCVNHAGLHMQLWYSSSHDSRRVYRYWADRQEGDVPGLFEIREAGDPTIFNDLQLAPGGPRSAPLGWLAISGHGKLRIDWAEGSGGLYRRFSSRATLSDRSVKALSMQLSDDEIVGGWLANEHAPVREAAVTQIVDHLTSHAFRDKLQAIMELEVDSGNLNRGEVRDAIDALILPETGGLRSKKLFDIPHEPDEAVASRSNKFPLSDRPRIAARLWPEMVAHTMRLRTPTGDSENRSIFEWLQRVLYYNKHYALEPTDVGVITRWLGIPFPGEQRYEIYGSFFVMGLDAGLPFSKALARFVPKAKEAVGKGLDKVIKRIEKFRWDWGQSLKGKKKEIEKQIIGKVGKRIEGLLAAHAGGKVLVGVMTVRAPNGGWEHPFEVVALIGSAGTGKGASKVSAEPFICSGYGLAGYDWKPEAFTGHFEVLGTEMSEDQFGTKKDKQMIWLLRGRGAGGQLQLVWTDVETKTSSMDIGWGIGDIVDIDDSTVDPAPVTPTFEYTEKLERSQDVHFVLGSAEPLPIARQLLRIFAANELALLRDPLSSLVILGYADRTGRPKFNRLLSKARAVNTRQALVDAIGDDLRADLMELGHGEDVLAALGEAFGFPDGQPNAQWRRCFVVLNGTIAATMGTNDWKTRGK
jgi:outer membrane protein OmpA-like peptidoglycan-associated protein